MIGVGGASSDDAWAAPEAAALTAAFAGGAASTSDIWTTLGRAVPASGASAVILVQRQRRERLPGAIPGLRRQVRGAGVPIAVLPVGSVDKAATDAIVADTHGQRFDPKASDLAARLGGFVADQVATAASTGYRLRYVAPTDGPTSRAVSVGIAGSTASPATLTYDVPAPADRSAPSGVAGVYLTVTVGGRVMRRRLGGVPASDRDVPSETADATAIAEATAALDAIRDDPLRTRDHDRTTPRRSDRGGADVRTAREGMGRWPGGDRDRLHGLAAVPGHPRGDVGTGHRRRDHDRRDTGRAHGVDPDRSGHRDGPRPPLGCRARVSTTGSAWARTRTAAFDAAARRIGRREHPRIPPLPRERRRSARRARPHADPGVRDRQFDALAADRKASLSPLATQYATFHRLVPTSGHVVAAWLVDPATGSLTAVGADGRGAGKDLSKCLKPEGADDLASFIATSIAMISMLCIATPGVIPQYACVGADVYGAGTAALGSFTAAPNIKQDVFNAASYAAGLAAADIGGLAGRSIVAVLLMMAGMLAGGSCA